MDVKLEFRRMMRIGRRIEKEMARQEREKQKMIRLAYERRVALELQKEVEHARSFLADVEAGVVDNRQGVGGVSDSVGASEGSFGSAGSS